MDFAYTERREFVGCGMIWFRCEPIVSSCLCWQGDVAAAFSIRQRPTELH